MRRRPQTRVLTTVLFTDIVGSTQLATELEDRRWRGLLSRHHALVRAELKRHGGREIDTAGDGFFAIFDQPAEAIRCAAAITEDVRRLGIEVRAGLHMGECEIMGHKVGGIAVHTAARLLAEAGASEVLISGTLRELVAGSGLTFDDRGVQSLKGVSGETRLYALRQPDRAGVLPDVKTVELEGPEPHPRWRRLPVLIVLGGAFALGIVAVVATRDDAPTRIGANSVAAIDPASGDVKGVVKVGTGPVSLAVSEGAVWVANVDDRTVSRIDTESLSEVPGRGDIGIPTAMDVDEEGVVWVADGVSNTLYEIDARTNRVEIHQRAGGNGVAVGFGFVWVIDFESDTVLRINPTTLDEERIQLEEGSGPAAVTTGHGAVWVANSLRESVTKISPTAEILASDIALCCAPTSISAGPSGVWVASQTSDKVMRIDPEDDSSNLSLDAADAPEGIAVADEGVWVANSHAQSIWEFDPETGEVVTEIAVDGSPRGVVVAEDGTVWVTVAPRS